MRNSFLVTKSNLAG